MFFDTFKELCDAKGVSCKRATIDMGFSNSISTKWKRTSATPNGETLNKIAEYFGVSVDYLLGQETEKAPTDNGERQISDDEIKAAFFEGADDLSQEEMDAMWDDARDYIQYKLEQRRRKKDD